jgi:hypothetical protein
MKLAKMSMVAALLLGANAYAIDNVKVSGDAKLYYSTTDYDDGVAGDAANGTEDGLFSSGGAAGDVALHLGLTADLTEGISAGVSMTALTTLGLENNLVNNTWSSAHTPDVNPNGGATALGAIQVNDEMWVDEAWLAGTAGKTTAKVGRQALDTPLVFTETWGIDKNTFEAGVVINQDLPDTTLVGAYIGKSNGSASNLAGAASGHGITGYVTEGAKFNSFYNGAYAAGIVNNSIKPLTLQAWYYDMQRVATAYWLQADLDMEGILVGGQYVNMDSATTGDKDDSAYAVMIGYAMKDVVTVKAAYSSVDDEGTFGVGNTATSTNESKLYTEMWWNRGNVSATGADSYSITAEGTAAGVDLSAGYYMADIDVLGTANDVEVTEIALTAGKSFGPLDTAVAIIVDEYDNATGADEEATTLQVYLTYNF